MTNLVEIVFSRVKAELLRLSAAVSYFKNLAVEKFNFFGGVFFR